MSRCANENLSPRSFLSQFSLSVARQTHLFLFFDVHEDAVMNLESFGRTKQKPTARDDRVLCLHVDHGAMHDEWVGLFGTGRLYRHLKRVTVREREKPLSVRARVSDSSSIELSCGKAGIDVPRVITVSR